MDLELAVLSSGPLVPHPENVDKRTYTLFENLKSGNFVDVLRSEPGCAILQDTESAGYSQLQSNVSKYLAKQDSDSRALDVLGVAISSLQLFVQNNWTGPVSPTEENKPDEKRVEEKSVLEDLSVDGDNIYSLCSHLVYLHIARTILLECRDLLQKCSTSRWWLLRCLQIHQVLLSERSPTLKATVMQLIQEIEKDEQLWSENSNRKLEMQFHIEAGNLCYFYYEPSDAKAHFNTARLLSGLEIGLTGALGKRTHFQEKNVSQLVLKVERTGTGSTASISSELAPVDSNLLPKDLDLGDDTVMEKIKFLKTDESFVADMTSAEQSLILALLTEHRKFHEGVGKIIQEESLAYIQGILQQPQDWCVQSVALLYRSTWENESSRRIERCMKQLEELVAQCKREEPDAGHRIQHVYDVKLPPKWEIERHLGELFGKLGAVNAALEVYLRLQMWEEVIKCYISSGRSEKAEEVIREQLANKESPEMWCYLGDVTHNDQDYMTSWELSNSHYPRAQRNLAYLYLSKGEFEKSLPCFQKSLEINPLQVGVWFSYGCASIGCENFEVAAQAFRRCVTLDPDNHEAWNNLSTAYIKDGQKPRAFLTLQEALKCDYENWRIWENYLLVGTDVGEFEQVIRAYHRLLEIRLKHEDAEVLRILSKAVNENLNDAGGKPSSRLRGKALELLGHVTAKVTTNGDIWKVYGELIMGAEDISQTDRERALQYFQKSHRCNTQSINWEKDVDKCKNVAEQSVNLAEAYLRCNEKITDHAQANRLLSSARLLLKGVLSKIKQRHTDTMSKELLSDLIEPVNSLEQELEKIGSCIEERKAALPT